MHNILTSFALFGVVPTDEVFAFDVDLFSCEELLLLVDLAFLSIQIRGTSTRCGSSFSTEGVASPSLSCKYGHMISPSAGDCCI